MLAPNRGLWPILRQVLIGEEKVRVDELTDTIDKQKIRIEFLLTELRRKQVRQSGHADFNPQWHRRCCQVPTTSRNCHPWL